MSVVAEPTGAEGRAATGRPPLAAGRPVPLVVEGVSKQFGRAVALEGVDLCVAAGSIVGLVGPNGSGKTTLLRSAAGLVTVDSGSIRVAGEPVGSHAARSSTALVPDEPVGFDELTGTEFVALAQALWKAGEQAPARASALASAFGLEGRLVQRMGTLSRGLRRQVSAVAALSLGTSLVLVDEATATLDPEAVVVLDEALKACAARGAGVVLATQDLHFAGATCDEVVLLHRGAIIDRGSPLELRARHAAGSIEEVFLAALGDGSLRSRTRDAFRAL
ncbi:ABC transporter ATP-binding protein [Gaiella sp.]|uniref:ABC transporter ATP-binding protein n=1 Tax=Gaiella sp. TaxID=2663207 RepID=UPI003983D596